LEGRWFDSWLICRQVAPWASRYTPALWGVTIEQLAPVIS